MGTIDVIFAGTSGFTSFYDKAKVLDLPFLFTSADEANEIVNSDIGEEIFGDMGQFGLNFLSEGDNGMRQISTTGNWKQITKADDVVGLKIRVPQSTMYTDVWSALGATPVALSLAELTTALSNGTADAQDNATYHEVANATWDNIKYFSYINYMWMGCTMAANSVSFGKLNAATQQLLKDQAKLAAQYSFDCIAKDNVTAQKTMEDGGVEFCEDPDVDSFKTKLDIPNYYTRYSSETWYDADLINKIYTYGK
jgi:TRAP-type C4-dicarboxylate transport system substrate-binding protein